MSISEKMQSTGEPVTQKIKVGEIVESKLTPEEAGIDRKIAKASGPELEELKRIKKAAGNINPLTFFRRIG